MKTLITCWILIIPLFAFTNSTEVDAIGRCLEEQLTSSSWSLTSGQQWEFTADGTLHIFDQTQQILRSGSWNLQVVANKLSLEIVNGTAVQYYAIAPHCDQENIVLKDFAQGELVLVPVRYDAAIFRALTGDWQKGFYGEEPFLTFKPNGSYVVTEVAQEHYELHTGRWSLMGNTLLLHNAEGELEAYLIKHLQMDELVLSPFNAQREDWYLNKL